MRIRRTMGRRTTRSRTTRSRRKRRSGQAMIIAVLTLGSVILGATTLAGLLMLYQIRAATDAVNSAKAIFAADAGVDWALFSYFHPPQGPLPGSPPGVLSNGASVAVTCFDAGDNPVACDQAPATTTAISRGFANTSRRAFFVDLASGTSTLP